MRIVLAISSLGAGGAERVMTLLAGALADRDHDVWLVTLAESGNDFFPLHPRVQRIGLGLTGDSLSALHGLRANAQRVWALRRTVATLKPHAVLSFVTSMNVLMILACMRLPVRVVVSERVDPAAHQEYRIWSDLRSLLYQFADAVVVQTESIAGWFRKRLWKRTRVAVIPNPAVPISGVEPCDDMGPFLLAAGRFTYQKGFDLLLRAFGEATTENVLKLVIAGEGPEAQTLRELAAQLGLGARVCFPGRVQELSRLLKCAVAFILPSRYEGFPNVLLEALAAGVPCVATDCPGATREILGDGAYGLLVPPDDTGALAGAINQITADAELRQRLSRAATVAIERYSLDRIIDHWERVLAGA